MSDINEKQVAKIARLAKIEISEDQKPQLAKKLKTILDWVESLNEVDTKDVEPLFNVHQMSLKMAEDEVSDGDIADQILKNAPDAKYNYFSVPKVIE